MTRLGELIYGLLNCRSAFLWLDRRCFLYTPIVFISIIFSIAFRSHRRIINLIINIDIITSLLWNYLWR